MQELSMMLQKCGSRNNTAELCFLMKILNILLQVRGGGRVCIKSFQGLSEGRVVYVFGRNGDHFMGICFLRQGTHSQEFG